MKDLKTDFAAKLSEMAERLRPPGAPVPPAQVQEQRPQASTSGEAFAACLILLPATWCEVEAGTTAPAMLPPVVHAAPASESSDMWEKHSVFFERFKEVWTACPGKVAGAGYIPAAHWLNENTAWYQQILKTCGSFKDEGGKRAWPPGSGATTSLRDWISSWK